MEMTVASTYQCSSLPYCQNASAANTVSWKSVSTEQVLLFPLVYITLNLPETQLFIQLSPPNYCKLLKKYDIKDSCLLALHISLRLLQVLSWL